MQHFDVLIFSNASLTACVRATSRAQPSVRQPGTCRCLRREAPHPFAGKPGSLRAESGQYSEMDHLNNPFVEIYLFKTFLTFYAEFPQILFRIIYENMGILASLFSKSLIFEKTLNVKMFCTAAKYLTPLATFSGKITLNFA